MARARESGRLRARDRLCHRYGWERAGPRRNLRECSEEYTALSKLHTRGRDTYGNDERFSYTRGDAESGRIEA